MRQRDVVNAEKLIEVLTVLFYFILLYMFVCVCVVQPTHARILLTPN